VIRTALLQFQSVVTVALEEFNRAAAVLALAAVTLIDPLAQGTPQVNPHAPVPREPHIWKFRDLKVNHTLPHPISPNPTQPGIAPPGHTLPHLAQPVPTTPYRASAGRT